MMQITIDGKQMDVVEGETILEVTRRMGIEIPTLCHHDALESVGACRLCVVEVSRNGWKDIVTSCQYPVEDGLEVFTDSERVREQRQTVLSLLLARCPDVPVVRDLAARYGEVIPYKTFDESEKCILCYLCTRTCAAVGPEAIAAVGRGKAKEIAPPFHGAAEACVGCGSCYRVCPTGCIEMEDTPEGRKIWGREFEFVKCDTCGAPMLTTAYRDYVVKRYSLDESYYTTCPSCKEKQTAKRFGAVVEAGKVGGKQ
jgi:bidirectional [NiFe] hydrogenase diaphorase subunit